MTTAVATAVSSRKKQHRYMYRDHNQIEMWLLTTCSLPVQPLFFTESLGEREGGGGGGGVKKKGSE